MNIWNLLNAIPAYNINEILEAEVVVLSTGLKKSLIIKNNSRTMTDEEIQERVNVLEVTVILLIIYDSILITCSPGKMNRR